jgi:hypothetical protein
VVDLFQAGQVDVLVCSFGVGSTGLTLTRSSRLILLDRPWTPGDAKQAEDRIRRIGQRAAEVQSLWVAGFPLDESLDRLLQRKDRNSLRVIEVNGGEGTTAAWFRQEEGTSRGGGGCRGGGGRGDIRDYLQQRCPSPAPPAAHQHIACSVRSESPRVQWWEGGGGGDGAGDEEGEERGGKENRQQGAGAEGVMAAVLREILMS